MEEKIHAPAIGELPTRPQLNRATLIAAGVAMIVLVTAILPGEYAIDPTGVGRLLGLTEMGEAKRAEAASAVAEATRPQATPAVPGNAAVPTAATSPQQQSGEVVLTLQPNQGEEVKATMQSGGEFSYAWSTDGARVNFELHGEEPGAASSDYTTYEKGTSTGESGTFKAPFTGTHGWFWRNRTDAPITITVRANGAFEKFVQVAK